MSKNIPKKVMTTIVKKTKERMDHEGKKTKFERRGKDGEFHEVLQEKVDAFQKRIGTGVISALSPASSTVATSISPIEADFS